MAGRKPKPKDEHILNGNPSNLKKADLEAVPDGTRFEKLPDPPEWLGEYAQKEWRRVGPILADAGRLTEDDLLSFTAYCQNVDIMVQASIEIKEKGMTIIGTRGKTRNPALAAFGQATTSLRAFAAEFGMTPSSRMRFKMPDDDGETLADLIGDESEDAK